MIELIAFRALQVVRGVSATISGVYLLPMVIGLLLSSVGRGQLIARRGRYKIYPIAGTALLVVALLLLSTLSGTRSSLETNVYFLILGLSLGLILQVLVIAVQNSADYAAAGRACRRRARLRAGNRQDLPVLGPGRGGRLRAVVVPA
jgi:predicted MFS family arabinose efflux permease